MVWLLARGLPEGAGTNRMDCMDFCPVERANLMECVGLFVNVFNNPPWDES